MYDKWEYFQCYLYLCRLKVNSSEAYKCVLQSLNHGFENTGFKSWPTGLMQMTNHSLYNRGIYKPYKPLQAAKTMEILYCSSVSPKYWISLFSNIDMSRWKTARTELMPRIWQHNTSCFWNLGTVGPCRINRLIGLIWAWG